jgi:hypothetical protein
MTRSLLHTSRGRLARVLVFALTFASLVFLLQISTHTHTNGQEEAACLLCQAAHIGATPAVSTVGLSFRSCRLGKSSRLALVPHSIVSSITPTLAHHPPESSRKSVCKSQVAPADHRPRDRFLFQADLPTLKSLAPSGAWRTDEFQYSRLDSCGSRDVCICV